MGIRIYIRKREEVKRIDAKAQRRKEKRILNFFAPLRLCVYSLSLLMLTSCGTTSPIPSTQWREISGRDDSTQPIYRANVPLHWKQNNPLPSHSASALLSDTTVPIAEFTFEGIRITIHSFPAETLESRVPPIAQINRWKRQFDELYPASVSISPQAFSGYVGLLFEGSGLMKQKETMVMGWSLQLAADHFRTLNRRMGTLQKRADITIKATGPRDLMAQYQREIIAFARSFELIDEVD